MATKKSLRVKLLKAMYQDVIGLISGEATSLISDNESTSQSIRNAVESIEQLERLHACLATVAIQEPKEPLAEDEVEDEEGNIVIE